MKLGISRQYFIVENRKKNCDRNDSSFSLIFLFFIVGRRSELPLLKEYQQQHPYEFTTQYQAVTDPSLFAVGAIAGVIFHFTCDHFLISHDLLFFEITILILLLLF